MTSEQLAKRAAECRQHVADLFSDLVASINDESAVEDHSVAFGALGACATVPDMIIACAAKAAADRATQETIGQLALDGLLVPDEGDA